MVRERHPSRGQCERDHGVVLLPRIRIVLEEGKSVFGAVSPQREVDRRRKATVASEDSDRVSLGTPVRRVLLDGT